MEGDRGADVVPGYHVDLRVVTPEEISQAWEFLGIKVARAQILSRRCPMQCIRTVARRAISSGL